MATMNETSDKIQDCGLIVLAGGKSTRMGTDKWRLQLEGSTVIERLLQTFVPWSRELTVVMADAESAQRSMAELWQTRHPGLRVACDSAREIGPLGGMEAGLAAAEAPFQLITAADMPFPSLPLASLLAEACRSGPHMAAVAEYAGRLHPLFAVYRLEALAPLREYIRCGGRKVMDFLIQLGHITIPEADIHRIDPAGRALFNMNRPGDYEEAQRIVADLGQRRKPAEPKL